MCLLVHLLFTKATLADLEFGKLQNPNPPSDIPNLDVKDQNFRLLILVAVEFLGKEFV